MVKHSPTSRTENLDLLNNKDLMTAVTVMYAEKSQDVLGRLEKMDPAVRGVLANVIKWAHIAMQINDKEVTESMTNI